MGHTCRKDQYRVTNMPRLLSKKLEGWWLHTQRTDLVRVTFSDGFGSEEEVSFREDGSLG